MNHASHHHPHGAHAHHGQSLNRTAWLATLHWGNLPTIALAVALAFAFGYALTLVPLLKVMSMDKALKLALASDTASITIMEIVDNGIMVVIPGAMDAGLASPLFWGSLAV